MAALFLAFLTLGITIPALILKNKMLAWVSVPLWVITGIVIANNYTWLAEAQWVFILIGAMLAFGMIFETSGFNVTKQDKEEDEIDPDLEEMVHEREIYDKEMEMFHLAIRGKRQEIEKPRRKGYW